MILDTNHNYMMGMMDWGPNSWIFIILGVLGFILILFILLYLLRKSSSGFHNLKTSNKRTPKEIVKNMESEDITVKVEYCPNCGQKVRDSSVVFCSYCGAKL